MPARNFRSPLSGLFLAAFSAVVIASLGCGSRTPADAPTAATAQAADSTGTAPSPDAAEAASTTMPDAAPSPEGSNSKASTAQDAPREAAEQSQDQVAQAPAEEAPPADEPQPDQPQRDDQPENEDVAADEGHPFPRRIQAPEFPQDMEWLNTSGPLRLRDLRGKFVLFDFWTYCCINCMHILPELKKLEKAFPNELVVIGVHSAKFETEQEAENIREAILRYEIEHPVVNDNQHEIWNSYGVRSWPTILLIDPEGYAVWGRSGEFKAEQVAPVLKEAIAYYREKGKLDPAPIHFDLLAHRQEETPLRYPGKVLADEVGKRLFIADSNHNRIVIADLDGNLVDVIGSGAMGANDGDYRQATFDHPQGMAVQGDTLYVADTENHLLRKVDLKEKRVTTIAGIGEQARSGWPGWDPATPFSQPRERWVGEPKKTAISSPWALWVHETDLYIAMAGPHQIWKMPLDESEIGPYAGNGREDIVDGPLLPRIPYDEGYSSFAQPSGLAGDGQWLYVADSEGSSIRAVPFDPKDDVKTVIGTSHLPYGRLFEFGDVDGQGQEVQLQHPLGVVYHDGKVYIADTYNDKVKELTLETKTVATLAGGEDPEDATRTVFDEPAGISYAAGTLYVADTNNHRIRTIHLESREVKTLEIQGLTPPEPVEAPKAPAFAGTPRTELPAAALKPIDGKVVLQVSIELPQGWKINAMAPNGYRVEADEESGPVDRAALGKTTRLNEPSATFTIELPVSGEGKETLDVGVTYYYCQEGGEGLCRVGVAAWTVPLEVSSNAEKSSLQLSHTVKE